MAVTCGCDSAREAGLRRRRSDGQTGGIHADDGPASQGRRQPTKRRPNRTRGVRCKRGPGTLRRRQQQRGERFSRAGGARRKWSSRGDGTVTPLESPAHAFPFARAKHCQEAFIGAPKRVARSRNRRLMAPGTTRRLNGALRHEATHFMSLLYSSRPKAVAKSSHSVLHTHGTSCNRRLSQQHVGLGCTQIGKI